MRSEGSWIISYDTFEPAKEPLREALCTLGNGYFGTRGAAYESCSSKIHYPGTYVAGVYNKTPTVIAGKKLWNDDLVNCPNWLFLTFKIKGDSWFSPSSNTILFYNQELDIKRGILIRRMRVRNKKGQRTLIKTERIVSMADPHMGAFSYSITPENYSDWIIVRTFLDGTILNTGVERYHQLNSKHWTPVSGEAFSKNGMYLSVKTSHSKIQLTQASRMRVFAGDKELKPAIHLLLKGRERIGQECRIFASEKNSFVIEKTMAMYTSRDTRIKNPQKAAIEKITHAKRFFSLCKAHFHAWSELWQKCDIQVEGHLFTQKAVRFHIFHLLQTVSPYNIAIDAGLPARGLHGEAYRGHVFWDQMFTMSLYDLHIPYISQALLMYRYRRLNRAREYAQSKGYRGAMFPWQSASGGVEETQIFHLNPLSGRWGPDYSSLQRHISFAVAYNVWQHWIRTANEQFFYRYGAEIFLSIAQFCASLARYDKNDKRYHTKGIMGPDEFHEKYPGAKKAGLKDNAYSNVMIVWILKRACQALDEMPYTVKKRLTQKLKIDKKTLRMWGDICRRMSIVINKEGVIAQFDGYFDLHELDWDGYRAEYGDIHRLDRILKAEGKSPDAYKVSKQADTLMMYYLLSEDEVNGIFSDLGYSLPRNALRKNYRYYLNRTSHGSTLSRVVHGFIAHRIKRDKESWSLFLDVLGSDLTDIQGGTTPEGIHCGVMGGSIDFIVRGFTGIRIEDDFIQINPRLPVQLKKIQFRFCYRKQWLSVAVTRHFIVLQFEKTSSRARPLIVRVCGTLYSLHPGKTLKASLSQ